MFKQIQGYLIILVPGAMCREHYQRYLSDDSQHYGSVSSKVGVPVVVTGDRAGTFVYYMDSTSVSLTPLI